MSHVFISYAREDHQAAQILQQQLERSGFEVWMQAPDLRFYSEWRAVVYQAIADSIAIIVVITPYAGKSGFVEYEWDFADKMGKPILPAVFAPSNELMPRYKPLDDLDFTDPTAYPWRTMTRLLLRAAQQVESQKPLPKSAAPAAQSDAAQPDSKEHTAQERIQAAKPLMKGGWRELRAGRFRSSHHMFQKALQQGLTDGEAERWGKYSGHMAEGLNQLADRKYAESVGEFTKARDIAKQDLGPTIWTAEVSDNAGPAQQLAVDWVRKTKNAHNLALKLQALNVQIEKGKNDKGSADYAKELKIQLDDFHFKVRAALSDHEATQPISLKSLVPKGQISADSDPVGDSSVRAKPIDLPSVDEMLVEVSAPETADSEAEGVLETLNGEPLPPSSSQTAVPSPVDRTAIDKAPSLEDVIKTTIGEAPKLESTAIAAAPVADMKATTIGPAPNGAVVGEAVNFTVYGPKEATPGKWYSLVIYAHTSNAQNKVRSDSGRFRFEMGEKPHESVLDNPLAMAPESEVTLTPECEGVTFNPQHVTLRCVEDVHRMEFRFKVNTPGAPRDIQIKIIGEPDVTAMLRVTVPTAPLV